VALHLLNDRQMRRIAVIAVLCLLVGSSGFATGEVPRSVVKAVFLLNFARFTEWPAQATTGPLTLCVLGDTEVASALDGLVGDRPINNREVSVARLATLQIVRGCHLLYVGGDDKKLTAGALEAVAALPVFTVGNSEAFVHKGGVSAFYTQGDRIRFAMNPDTLTRAGLKVSSKVLGLARIVREER
jgi:hypothetical protein